MSMTSTLEAVSAADLLVIFHVPLFTRWLKQVTDGGTRVLMIIDAPDDLEAMTFLKDAPPAREFWARRQAHETTIHMVDALAASLGRLPTAEEVNVDTAVAVDGIDELLRGFFTRGRSKLYDGADYTIAVAPTDAPRRWVVNVAERLTVEPGDPEGDTTDATISGTASAVYLALWNRGSEMQAAGRADVVERWRATQRVTWN